MFLPSRKAEQALRRLLDWAEDQRAFISTKFWMVRAYEDKPMLPEHAERLAERN